MAHLSAESGLYCRVFTEGLFGIVPKGLRSFSCTPRLPKAWDKMALRKIKAFGQEFDLEVVREAEETISVLLKGTNGKLLDKQMLKEGEALDFSF